MLKLIGSLKVGGKTFSASDSDGAIPRNKHVQDNFYGGRVKDFLKTKEGFLLCRDKRGNLFDIAYDEDSLTDEGKKLLGIEVEESVNCEETKTYGQTNIEQMNTKELREYAKGLGLTFRVGTTKEDMVKAILEKECETSKDKNNE